ncbi:MAG: UDP-N-acetylmuramate--L-alanine ligase [Candidatus Omnitrophica bacterium]|nr:UDP-N-acetylmuramate--L-alanine ligase [Candidatus Omnitrophota bacterium]
MNPPRDPTPASPALLEGVRRIHFIGIGGIGMSGLARIVLDLGHEVSGSDIQRSALVESLRASGAVIHQGHAAGHLQDAEAVVYSTSIRPDNPEFAAARSRGLRLMHRGELLGALANARRTIAVTGAHGKTTTTGLVAQLLSEAGCDPTYLVGGEIATLGGNARLGRGPWCVAEADESDSSFLYIRPERAVLTNIDREHLDHYGHLERIQRAFAQFIGQMAPDGRIVACRDNEPLQAVIAPWRDRVTTFGLHPEADYYPQAIERSDGGMVFQCSVHGAVVGEVRLQIPGEHNVSNALAAIAVGHTLELPWEAIQRALARYPGAARRFEVMRLPQEVTAINDYAHHPTEIRATLDALPLEPPGRIIAVFQPHRYTRTRALAREFATCFARAHRVVITDIYAAHDPILPGIDGAWLQALVRQAGHPDAQYVPKRALLDTVLDMMQPRDTIVFLGAGDIGDLSHAFATRAQQLHTV